MLHGTILQSLPAVGLILDIFGVMVLAIPDFRLLAERFRFGKLRSARENLRFNGLTSDDAGFEEIVSLHNDSQPNVEITSDDVDNIEYGPEMEPVFQDGDLTGFEVNIRLKFNYADETEFAGLDVQNSGMPPEHIYPEIIRLIEQGERRFRLGGLSLIVLGFAFQLVGTGLI